MTCICCVKFVLSWRIEKMDRVQRLLGFVIVSAFILTSFTAHAARKTTTRKSLASTCSSTISVVGNPGLIYKNSAPLRSGGVGTPLVGYRREPTLILVRNLSSRSTGRIFDKAGNAIGSCPWASAHDTYGGRLRCTMSTSGLRKTAVRNTNSAEIYFLIHGKKKLCVKIPDAGRCYGSSKGLCSQLIR